VVTNKKRTDDATCTKGLFFFSTPAYTDMLHYTTTLLKNMYSYIPKEEQIRLANSIQRIITLQKRLTVTTKPDINDNYWGVNIINSIKVVPAIPRKQLYQHPLGKKRILNAISGHETERRRSSDPSETTDPFIYNPFTQKKTYEKASWNPLGSGKKS
jgi:hypothetical protein